MLGICLRHGWGCHKNEKGAIICFRKSISLILQSLAVLPNSFPHGYTNALDEIGPHVELISSEQELEALKKIDEPKLPQSLPQDTSEPGPSNSNSIPALKKRGSSIYKFHLNDSQSLSSQTTTPQTNLENLLHDLETVKSLLPLPMYELANCYRYGWGVSKNIYKASRLYTIGARLGDLDSQLTLTHLYSSQRTKFTLYKRQMAYWLRQAENCGWSTFNESWIWKEKYDPKEGDQLDSLLTGNAEQDGPAVISMVQEYTSLMTEKDDGEKKIGCFSCYK